MSCLVMAWCHAMPFSVKICFPSLNLPLTQIHVQVFCQPFPIFVTACSDYLIVTHMKGYKGPPRVQFNWGQYNQISQTPLIKSARTSKHPPPFPRTTLGTQTSNIHLIMAVFVCLFVCLSVIAVSRSVAKYTRYWGIIGLMIKLDKHLNLIIQDASG